MENSGNIIICSDGTDNRFGRHNTNVVRLFQTLDCGENQKCFYDPGVGTYTWWVYPYQYLNTLDRPGLCLYPEPLQ